MASSLKLSFGFFPTDSFTYHYSRDSLENLKEHKQMQYYIQVYLIGVSWFDWPSQLDLSS